ncbi:protein kinase domain-containing protein [Streptomyces sp. bgisy100]|uniref:serine/threonine-protein kinase n=1 Tax=Streptomyces sp. bgisy100 TaxID=3413783 RepID=UPI003D7481E2
MDGLRSDDPQRIGAYRLLGRLGAGGMGLVYLARSDRGRTVAVKLVRQELAEQEEFRRRFRQEVQAARRVGGAWTAPVLDADTEAPTPWVATGYIAGPSLQSVIAGHGPLPERSVRFLTAGLARALMDIHGAGLIHRDLKPSNVLVTIDGPRVIDFGIARALESVTGDGHGLTRTGSLVGSPGFMSPEQVRGERITAACDVFCLGSVLAYAATGKLPFGSASSGVALMFRIAEEAPNLDALPEGLRELAADCLAKDPAQRPTPAQVLERTDAEAAAGEPWLPGGLVAELGRHAVQLLDAENPEPPPAPAAAPMPAAVPPATGQPVPGQPAPGQHGGGPATGQPGTGPAPGPSAPSTGGVHALPTMISAPGTPPPGQGTPPYGPPAGAGAYGYPQPGHGPAAAGGYGYPPAGYPASGYAAPQHPGPYATTVGYAPEPEPRRRRTTVLMVAVALVVAVAGGTTVYTVMQQGHTGGGARQDSVNARRSGEPATSGKESGTSSESASGGIPRQYLGTWEARLGAGGSDVRRFTLRQGDPGDAVFTMTADGTNYHCSFAATLRSVGPPVQLEPSTVTAGTAQSCKAGPVTTLELTDSGHLRRTFSDGSAAVLTYSKVD